LRQQESKILEDHDNEGSEMFEELVQRVSTPASFINGPDDK